jgi:general secretion pathway protein E
VNKLERLAEILVEKRFCDSISLDRGRRVAAEQRARLDKVLVQLGLLTERQLAEAYCVLTGAPLTNAACYPKTPKLPLHLKAAFLRSARACPLAVSENEITLAVVDPLDDFTPAAVAAATSMQVRLEVAVPIELESAMARLYPDDTEEDLATDYDGATALENDVERLRALASEAPIIRLVNQIMSRAVETQASDIHIEPAEDRLRIRYRYDGVLHEADCQPARHAPAIISRIKIMAKLDIAERRLPQDGRIEMAVRGTDIDFRVSSIPSLFGESAVMRILDRSKVDLDYVKLGLPRYIIEDWTRALELPNGILLVTGPTGSGKTTTLYAGLNSINTHERKIFTVEDPIEYQLAGITQTQIKPQIGLTFAAMLRSILRQDPDVIMVGEIRDLETAQIAVQAALTGHIVLSTLHTNSAAAAVTRLRDLGLDDYLVTAVLRGVMAQRLVRRLCEHCKREEEVPQHLIDHLGLQKRAGTRRVQLWRPDGCLECRNTGYKGRQAIAEFLTPNAEIEKLILAGADHNTIEQRAVENGMITMLQAGLDAALAGTTTIQEVLRCIRAEAN